ncbi:MAG: hypothetical protein RLZZ76_9 [Candidatus Parcubacteria bacterium]|jgi:hypothetical protein
MVAIQFFKINGAEVCIKKQEYTMKLSLSVAAIVISTLVGGAAAAFAGQNCGVNCSDPVKGKRGKNWEVDYCVVGSPGNYMKVGCKSSAAVHLLPNGKRGVCFIGTDGRVHYSIQPKVWEGREFFNQKHQGQWMINWQS